MTQMLDDVLLIGKSDAGMLECQRETVDVRAFCQSMVEEVSSVAGQVTATRNAVHLRIAPDVHSAAFAPELLRHIFSNLLSHAIKYSPDGGEVGFDVKVDGSNLDFSVVDQGIGIPADAMKGLLELIFRAGNVAEISGTGLGLSIVKRAVEIQGGSIPVSSTLGQGSRFVIVLPI